MNLKKLVLGMTFSLAALSAKAGVVDGVGHWSGKGAIFSSDGVKTSEFDVALTNTALDANTLKTDGQITLPNGSVQSFSQTMADTANGFSIQSAQGTGGGYNLGDGMLTAYIGDEHQGTALTIVFGSDKTSYRVLATELVNGKATGFVRENLSRDSR